jgi:hypothetical protein
MSLSIPGHIFNSYNDAVDNLWSKKMTLVYPETRVECPNCTFNGYKSNGIYKAGGPYPFEDGFPCPYCNGIGYKMNETTEDIYGRIYYDRKLWMDVGVPINVPSAQAQTVCKLTDLAKLQQCKYLIPFYYGEIDSYQNQTLVRISDYFPQGFTQNPTKYVITLWANNA